jgi:transcriptional regulator with XRE-family HTH domain
MPRRNPNDDLLPFVRSELRRRYAAGETDGEMAAIVGVSGPMINQVKNGKRGVGDSLVGYARLLTNGSVDQLMARAAEYNKAHPPQEGTQERVEYDARYPNLSKAIRAARDFGMMEMAIQNVASSALKSALDPHPAEWLADIQAEERRLRRERRDPVGAAKARAESETRARAHLEELRKEPSFDERLAAIQARKAAEPPPAEPARKTGLKAPKKKA